MRDVLALGEPGELDLPALDPLRVGVLGGQRRLDLLVLDDPVLGRVDEEHPAGLQPALLDHPGLLDVEHADLGGEDDQAVLGDPVAGGAQTVAVQHGTDLRAVGEGHAGRAVPGLHQVGVVLVEGAAGRVHRDVVLPRLGDHHQHRVRQRTAAEVEQLQDLVEGGRVGVVRGADREDPLQALAVAVRGNQVGGELGLPGGHPVPVALDRVDLAVVRDEAVRVGERPAREGVGGEPRVHQAERGGVEPVRQVGEEGLQLAGGQHALVDDGARGQRREVDPGLALGALADHEGDPVELDAGPVRAGQEELAEPGHDAAGGRAQQVRGDRDVAPAEDGQVLLGRDGLDPRDGGGVLVVGVGQEGDADRVGADRREFEVDLGAQEGVRDLGEDAGAVTGVRLCAGGAAVLQVAQDGQRLLDDGVVGDAGQRGDESDATGVVLVSRVVQALSSRSRIRNERVRRAGGAGLGLVGGVHGCRQHRLSRRRLWRLVQ